MPGASLDDIVGHTLTLKHTSAIRAHLVANYEAATANKMLSALRGTLKADWRLHLIETDPYLRAIDFQNVAGGSDEPYGRMLSLGEAISIFTACNDCIKAGARDAAMFAVAYSAGMPGRDRQAHPRRLRPQHRRHHRPARQAQQDAQGPAACRQRRSHRLLDRATRQRGRPAVPAHRQIRPHRNALLHAAVGTARL